MCIERDLEHLTNLVVLDVRGLLVAVQKSQGQAQVPDEGMDSERTIHAPVFYPMRHPN